MKLSAALTIAGSSITGYTLLQPENVLSSSGIIRFGRAAVTVARIVVDYKSSLRDIDPTSEQYLLLKSQVVHRCRIISHFYGVLDLAHFVS